MILRHLLLPDILELVEAGRLSEVRDFLIQQPAPEIADFMTALDSRDQVLVFRILPRNLADEVFSLLEPHYQNSLITGMTQEEVKRVLAALPPDDRTALFEELPANVTKSLLPLLSDHDRKQTLTLLSYPEGSVGRLMTDRYVTLNPDWTVEEAIEHLRQVGTDSETLTMLYVTDKQGHLVDEVYLRKLVLSEPSIRVSTLMDSHFSLLHSLDDREYAIQVFRKFDLYALPVVDADGVLLGIVTLDDMLDVAEEEATEDFHKLVTVRPLHASFKEATVRLLVRKRIGWLLALIGVNIFSGAGIALFEDSIKAVVTLVVFMPLLIGSGGNAGAQSSTLIVRALATGDITGRDWQRLFLREIVLSTCLGLMMAVTVFFLGLFRGSIQIGFAVALSMLGVIVMGSLIGTLLPLILHKLRLDPAIASGPLITSMADILGILIYFSIATAILQI